VPHLFSKHRKIHDGISLENAHSLDDRTTSKEYAEEKIVTWFFRRMALMAQRNDNHEDGKSFILLQKKK
jgi:hypothetical protein